jgi:hypothetical protein
MIDQSSQGQGQDSQSEGQCQGQRRGFIRFFSFIQDVYFPTHAITIETLVINQISCFLWNSPVDPSIFMSSVLLTGQLKSTFVFLEQKIQIVGVQSSNKSSKNFTKFTKKNSATNLVSVCKNFGALGTRLAVKGKIKKKMVTNSLNYKLSTLELLFLRGI